jgi:DNA-binding PadR family transcriptional regulator
MASHISNTNGINKDSSNSEARKYTAVDGKRFGYLERTILEYASKHLYLAASEIREYIKRDIQIDLRRIHDALQRLVKKGVVEKVSRGIYRLTEYGKKLLNTLLSQKAHKESDTKWRAAGAMVDFGRYRFHVINARGGLEDLVRQLYALYRVVGCALGYFRGLLGKRRFYRVVRGVSVVCVDYFVGGHGSSLFGKGRSLKRPLFSLEYFFSLGLRPREIGIDVFAVSSVKPSIKAYFG